MTDAEALFALYQDRLRRYLGRLRRNRARQGPSAGGVPEGQPGCHPCSARAPAGGWLFRIARNLALDHHRQRNRRPEEAIGTFDRTKGASQETTTALDQALSTLPELDRDVFLMREMSGLSVVIENSGTSTSMRFTTHRSVAITAFGLALNERGQLYL